MGVGSLTFNGISTVDATYWLINGKKVGIVIQSPPVYEFPSKDVESIHVEGKSGDVIIDKNSYKNVKRTYSVAAIFGTDTSFVAVASKLTNWLLSAKGYVKLEDTYEPLYYRLAQFSNPGELRNFYDRVTAIPLSFDCKPQRFLKSGDTQVPFDMIGDYKQIINPTLNESLPEITLDLHSSGELEVIIEFFSGPDYLSPTNYHSVTIMTSKNLTIDCEYQECYDELGYVNNKVFLENGFPKFHPGLNWVKYAVIGAEGTMDRILIKPKWWTL